MPIEVRDYPSTDELDRAIAVMLAQDARLSFRKIAADLGVTEGTVRGRVKRLQGSGLLKLVPILDIDRGRDPEAANGGASQQMMFITVRCASGRLDDVRKGLLAIPQVSALYDANAAPRLVAVCILPSLEDASRIMDKVIALDGIREAESELVLETIKYHASIGPIATLEDLGSGLANPAFEA